MVRPLIYVGTLLTKLLVEAAEERLLIEAADERFFDEVQQEDCDKIKQCGCIKGTICGWCEAPNNPKFERALVGLQSGPWHGNCPHWVAKAADCTSLRCDEHYTNKTRVFMFGTIPMLCFLIWLGTWLSRIFRRIQRYRTTAARKMNKLEEFDHGVAQTSFKVGQATAASNNDFLSLLRTFERFRKGPDCPKAERLPDDFPRPYQRSIEDFRRALGSPRCFTMRVATQRDVALGSTLLETVSLVLTASITIAALRVAASYMERDNYRFLVNILNEISKQVSRLQGMVGTMISFYALGRVRWWWKVQTIGFTVQRGVEHVAMLAGTRRPSKEEEWHEQYQLYRWLICAFFFTYRGLVPYYECLKEHAMLRLQVCGLLTPQETSILNKAHRGPLPVIEAWITDWIEKHLHHESRLSAMQTMKALRGTMAGVSDLLDQKAPVSFEVLLYVTTYSYCFMLPFGPSEFNFADRYYVAYNYHIFIVIGVFLKSTFFLSLLRMLESLHAPFGFPSGDHGDSFHPESIMLKAEQGLRDYLTSERPGSTPEESTVVRGSGGSFEVSMPAESFAW